MKKSQDKFGAIRGDVRARKATREAAEKATRKEMNQKGVSSGNAEGQAPNQYTATAFFNAPGQFYEFIRRNTVDAANYVTVGVANGDNLQDGVVDEGGSQKGGGAAAPKIKVGKGVKKLKTAKAQSEEPCNDHVAELPIFPEHSTGQASARTSSLVDGAKGAKALPISTTAPSDHVSDVIDESVIDAGSTRGDDAINQVSEVLEGRRQNLNRILGQESRGQRQGVDDSVRLRQEIAKLTASHKRMQEELKSLTKKLQSNSGDKKGKIFSKTPLIRDIESMLQENSYPELVSWNIVGSRVYLPYYKDAIDEYGVTPKTDLDMWIRVDDRSMENFLDADEGLNCDGIKGFLKKFSALSPYFIEGDFEFRCVPFFHNESLINLNVNFKGRSTENPDLDITICGSKYRKSEPICGIDAIRLECKGGGKGFELKRGVLEPKKSHGNSLMALNPSQREKVLARLFSMLIRLDYDLAVEVSASDYIMECLKEKGCLDQIVQAVKVLHKEEYYYGKELSELVRDDLHNLLSPNTAQCKENSDSYTNILKLNTKHNGSSTDGSVQSSGGFVTAEDCRNMTSAATSAEVALSLKHHSQVAKGGR